MQNLEKHQNLLTVAKQITEVVAGSAAVLGLTMLVFGNILILLYLGYQGIPVPDSYLFYFNFLVSFGTYTMLAVIYISTLLYLPIAFKAFSSADVAHGCFYGRVGSVLGRRESFLTYRSWQFEVSLKTLIPGFVAYFQVHLPAISFALGLWLYIHEEASSVLMYLSLCVLIISSILVFNICWKEYKNNRFDFSFWQIFWVPLAANIGILVQCALVMYVMISILNSQKVKMSEYYFYVGVWSILVPTIIFNLIAFMGWYLRGKAALFAMLALIMFAVLFSVGPIRLAHATLRAFGLGGEIPITMYVTADKYASLPAWAKLESDSNQCNFDLAANKMAGTDIDKARFSLCKTDVVALVLDAGSRIYFRETNKPPETDKEIMDRFLLRTPLRSGAYISVPKDFVSWFEKERSYTLSA